ncbi:MAG: hypothetical protein AAF500_00355 [Myxococcota bacterium]
MTREASRWMVSMVALGIAARVLVWSLSGGFHHPDEIFQYLEPAHYLRTGHAWLPWEFSRGLRSWVPPAYYAALLEVLSWTGCTGLAAQRAVALHNALLSLLLIPAAYRIGLALAQDASAKSAARWSSLFAAVLPALVYFTPHTLIGVPSMIALAWGWVFWLEARRDDSGANSKMVWCGLLFGLVGSLRVILGFHMLVPLVDLLWRYRVRAIRYLTLGALAPVVLFGLVDWVTWGSWFHTTIEYVRYNYLEGAREISRPWYFYLTDTHWRAMGPAAVVSVLVALVSWRRTWVLMLTILVPTVALSTVGYKAHRLLMVNWFALAVLLGVGMSTISNRAGRRWPRRGALAATLIAALVVASNAWGISNWPWTWRRGVFRAQDFVGRQDDATGLLLDGRRHLNGGSVVLNRPIPQAEFRLHRTQESPFNYAALRDASPEANALRHRGWSTEATFDDIVVLKRSDSEP